MSKSITIATTKRGLAATWERGGGLTSGGSATIIAKPDGSMPRAVYVRRGGHLACGDHALVALHEGYYLVHAGVNRGTRSSGRIERVVSVSVRDIDGAKFEATAEVEVVNTFTEGSWDRPLDAKLEAAVEAAFGKASTYHNRSAWYVDTSERKPETPEQRKRREAEMAEQDAERARLRADKAAADAKAKAEAEAASRAALPTLLPRLSALVDRLVALKAANPTASYTELELGDSRFSFGWGLKDALYTEENVATAEWLVASWEEQDAKRQERAAILPRFQVFISRVEALGLSLRFGDEKVGFSDDGYYGGYSYDADGLESFEAALVRREEEAAERAREEAAAAAKAAAEAEAAQLGLPANVTIWRRMGGMTNRGNGWVIRPDGTHRERDELQNPNDRRASRYDEGDLVWWQILPGELVLRYHQADRYDIAHCEVVHRPEVVTREQLIAAKQIEEDMEAAENAFGLDDRLGKLLDRRAAAIEGAMAELPQALWPDDGWTLEVLASANGLALYKDARSWVNHAAPFPEWCEGREAQVVYELPAADGTLQVVAYDKWGAWNLNLWWRESTEVAPAASSSDEPEQTGASLEDLAAFFNNGRN